MAAWPGPSAPWQDDDLDSYDWAGSGDNMPISINNGEETGVGTEPKMRFDYGHGPVWPDPNPTWQDDALAGAGDDMSISSNNSEKTGVGTEPKMMFDYGHGQSNFSADPQPKSFSTEDNHQQGFRSEEAEPMSYLADTESSLDRISVEQKPACVVMAYGHQHSYVSEGPEPVRSGTDFRHRQSNFSEELKPRSMHCGDDFGHKQSNFSEETKPRQMQSGGNFSHRQSTFSEKPEHRPMQSGGHIRQRQSTFSDKLELRPVQSGGTFSDRQSNFSEETELRPVQSGGDFSDRQSNFSEERKPRPAQSSADIRHRQSHFSEERKPRPAQSSADFSHRQSTFSEETESRKMQSDAAFNRQQSNLSEKAEPRSIQSVGDFSYRQSNFSEKAEPRSMQSVGDFSYRQSNFSEEPKARPGTATFDYGHSSSRFGMTNEDPDPVESSFGYTFASKMNYKNKGFGKSQLLQKQNKNTESQQGKKSFSRGHGQGTHVLQQRNITSTNMTSGSIPSLLSLSVKKPDKEIILETLELKRNQSQPIAEPKRVQTERQPRTEPEKTKSAVQVSDDDEDLEHVQSQVFISDIPHITTEAEMCRMLKSYTAQVWIGRHEDGTGKLCAFVKLSSMKVSKKLIAEMNEFVYKGKKISLRFTAAQDFSDYIVHNQKDEDPEHVQSQVFISDIPHITTEAEMCRMLKSYTAQVWIGKHENGTGKLCAFVKLASMKESKKLIAEMNEFGYNGRKISLRFTAAQDFSDYIVRNQKGASTTDSETNEFCVHVSNLPTNVPLKDFQKDIENYHPIDVDLISREGTSFALLKFRSFEDANRMVSEQDFQTYYKKIIRVQFADASIEKGPATVQPERQINNAAKPAWAEAEPGTISCFQKYVSKECPGAPLLGLRYITEYVYPNGNYGAYVCTACEVLCKGQEVAQHVVGFFHRCKSFEKTLPHIYNEICKLKDLKELGDVVAECAKLAARNVNPWEKITTKTADNPNQAAKSHFERFKEYELQELVERRSKLTFNNSLKDKVGVHPDSNVDEFIKMWTRDQVFNASMIGLEYIIEILPRKQGGPVGMICECCNVQHQGNKLQFLSHVCGYKHRMKYFSLKRPDIEDRLNLHRNISQKGLNQLCAALEREMGRHQVFTVTEDEYEWLRTNGHLKNIPSPNECFENKSVKNEKDLHLPPAPPAPTACLVKPGSMEWGLLAEWTRNPITIANAKTVTAEQGRGWVEFYKDLDLMPPDLPLLGLGDFIEMQTKRGTTYIYSCELCKTGNFRLARDAVMTHLTIWHHRLNYMNKYYPDIAKKVETLKSKTLKKTALDFQAKFVSEGGTQRESIKVVVLEDIEHLLTGGDKTVPYNPEEPTDPLDEPYISDKPVVCMSNLPADLTKIGLETYISNFNHVGVDFRRVGRRSFAYVSFDCEKEAQRMVDKLNLKTFLGQNIVVVMNKVMKTEPSISMAEQTPCDLEPGITTETREGKITSVKLYELLEDVNYPVVGLSYVTEMQNNFKDAINTRKYLCKMCPYKCGRNDMIIEHLSGNAHRLKFLETNYPVLFNKCQGHENMVEKFVQEIEEQFGREAISVKTVIGKNIHGHLYSMPQVVKAPPRRKMFAPLASSMYTLMTTQSTGSATQPSSSASITKQTNASALHELKWLEDMNMAFESGRKKDLTEEVDIKIKEENIETKLSAKTREESHFDLNIAKGLDDTPLIGLQYITEVQHPTGKFGPVYECSLCNLVGRKTSLITTLIVCHICSRSHRMNFFKENHENIYQAIIGHSDMHSVNNALDKYTKEIESKVGRGNIQKVVSLQDSYWDRWSGKGTVQHEKSGLGTSHEKIPGQETNRNINSAKEIFKIERSAQSKGSGQGTNQTQRLNTSQNSSASTSSKRSVSSFIQHEKSGLGTSHDKISGHGTNRNINSAKEISFKIERSAQSKGSGQGTNQTQRLNTSQNSSASTSSERKMPSFISSFIPQNNQSATVSSSKVNTASGPQNLSAKEVLAKLALMEASNKMTGPGFNLQKIMSQKEDPAIDWKKLDAEIKDKIQGGRITKCERKCKLTEFFASFFKENSVLGLQCVMEIQKPDVTQPPWYICRACEDKILWKGIVNHLKNPKHNLKYMEKCRPSLFRLLDRQWFSMKNLTNMVDLFSKEMKAKEDNIYMYSPVVMLEQLFSQEDLMAAIARTKAELAGENKKSSTETKTQSQSDEPKSTTSQQAGTIRDRISRFSDKNVSSANQSQNDKTRSRNGRSRSPLRRSRGRSTSPVCRSVESKRRRSRSPLATRQQQRTSSDRRREPASDRTSSDRCREPASDRTIPHRRRGSASDRTSPDRRRKPASDRTSPNRCRKSTSDRTSPDRRRKPASDRKSPDRRWEALQRAEQYRQRKANKDIETIKHLKDVMEIAERLLENDDYLERDEMVHLERSARRISSESDFSDDRQNERVNARQHEMVQCGRRFQEQSKFENPSMGQEDLLNTSGKLQISDNICVPCVPPPNTTPVFSKPVLQQQVTFQAFSKFQQTVQQGLIMPHSLRPSLCQPGQQHSYNIQSMNHQTASQLVQFTPLSIQSAPIHPASFVTQQFGHFPNQNEAEQFGITKNTQNYINNIPKSSQTFRDQAHSSPFIDNQNSLTKKMFNEKVEKNTKVRNENITKGIGEKQSCSTDGKGIDKPSITDSSGSDNVKGKRFLSRFDNHPNIRKMGDERMRVTADTKGEDQLGDDELKDLEEQLAMEMGDTVVGGSPQSKAARSPDYSKLQTKTVAKQPFHVSMSLLEFSVKYQNIENETILEKENVSISGEEFEVKVTVYQIGGYSIGDGVNGEEDALKPKPTKYIFTHGGRIEAQRIASASKLVFYDLVGIYVRYGKIQIQANASYYPSQEEFLKITKVIKINDVVGVEGKPYKTKTGNLGIIATRLLVLPWCPPQLQVSRKLDKHTGIPNNRQGKDNADGASVEQSYTNKQKSDESPPSKSKEREKGASKSGLNARENSDQIKRNTVRSTGVNPNRMKRRPVPKLDRRKKKLDWRSKSKRTIRSQRPIINEPVNKQLAGRRVDNRECRGGINLAENQSNQCFEGVERPQGQRVRNQPVVPNNGSKKAKNSLPCEVSIEIG